MNNVSYYMKLHYVRTVYAPCSVIFKIFQHCENTGCLLKYTFIFDRVHHSLAVVTPVIYESDSENQPGIFAESSISLTDKLTNRTLATPTPDQDHYDGCRCPGDKLVDSHEHINLTVFGEWRVARNTSRQPLNKLCSPVGFLVISEVVFSQCKRCLN